VDVRFATDPSLFARQADDFMRGDPFTTSVIGVRALEVPAGLRPLGPDDLWVEIQDHGRVVGVAMHTPPFHCFVSRMPVEAATCLAQAVFDSGRVVTGVNGEKTAASAFASRWTELSGQLSTVEVSLRLYRLGRLCPPSAVPGAARSARHDDLEMVTEWLRAFHAEAAPNHPAEDLADRARRRIDARQLTVWVHDEEPVSIAGCSAPVMGVARVGPVYTPPGHRRHGYGTAVTAYASGAALDKGAAHVVLYTDLSNPTSNSVYQSIGYVKDHDAEERYFVR
jgi:predicted GNAT family acetyltransferase